MKVRVTWQVDDGYVGKSRPQITIIPEEEFEDCKTEADRNAIIEEFVDSDFQNRISWFIDSIDEIE